jgi:outer membrane immunogenic protein
MRRLSIAIIAAASTVAFSQIAAAADMPVKAPPPVAAPAYNWTGFYVGASAGYGWTGDDVTLAAVGTSLIGFSPFPQFVSVAANSTAMTLNTDPHGFIGGGQFGYNYQINRWVWGLEADFSGAGIKGSETKEQTTTFVVLGFPALSAKITGTAEQKLDFFGTVRGRLGFTPIDSVLIYATGGLAYGHVESSTSTADAILLKFSTGPASGSASAMRAGWTVGGGVESMLAFAPRWSFKVEYLYYDLGKLTYALSPAAVTEGGGVIGFVNTTATADFHGNLVRVGLNYQFH